jgi:hypothetical protein
MYMRQWTKWDKLMSLKDGRDHLCHKETSRFTHALSPPERSPAKTRITSSHCYGNTFFRVELSGHRDNGRSFLQTAERVLQTQW